MAVVEDGRRTAKQRVRERFTQTGRYALTIEQEEVLDALAGSLFDGNRNAAIRYLLDLHGGRLLEQRQDAEIPPAPFEVVAFRKPRLDRELAAFVAGSIAAGLPREVALDLAGVTPAQRREWMKRGQSDRQDGKETIYADFVTAVMQAEAMQKRDNIEHIRRHRAKTWTSAAWLLDRVYPDEFGERKRVDSKVQHSLMPMIDYDRLTLQEARTLVHLLRKASPEQGDPGIGRLARPAAELLPADVVDAVEDAEFDELDDGEAPALETGSSVAGEAPPPEAPALEKPGS